MRHLVGIGLLVLLLWLTVVLLAGWWLSDVTHGLPLLGNV